MVKRKMQKNDQGKLRWDLIPIDSLRAIIQVLMFGAQKYAPNNWLIGCDWSRTYNACLRHLTSFWAREGNDPETGFSHLWHAGCCILFLIAYEIRGLGRDDRYIKP
jgi:hypothetical protein